MATESLDQFLVRRERELVAQIAALRGQLAPREAELQRVLEAKQQLAQQGEVPRLEEVAPRSLEKYSEMTIKQLVVRALNDHFPSGARSGDLREFIHAAYGREISSGSFRPQLHRLKANKTLLHDRAGGVWALRSPAA